MTVTLERLPNFFRAGTTVTYTRTVEDYPPCDGWTLNVYLNGASKVTATAVPTSDNLAYTVTFSATDTAALLPGTYFYVEQVSKSDGKVLDVRNGKVEVRQNIATANAGDFQSIEERHLAALNAVIDGRITKDMESYIVEGMQIVKTPMETLEKLRDKYKALVYTQKTGRFGRSIEAIFIRPRG